VSSNFKAISVPNFRLCDKNHVITAEYCCVRFT
jgi:hypothetical protein